MKSATKAAVIVHRRIFQNAYKSPVKKTKNFNQATRSYEKLMNSYPEDKARVQDQIANFSATEFPESNDWDHDQLTLEIAEQDTKLIQLEIARQSYRNILIEISSTDVPRQM